MLNDKFENKGIYGYSKSKEKRRMDTLLDNMKGQGTESADAFVPSESLADVGTTLDRVNQTTGLLADKEQRSAYHHNVARESLVPADTEERRRRQFVLSRNVVDDAVDDYYNSSVFPEFQKQRETAENRASDIYRQHYAVPGVDPLGAMGAARNVADPAKVINNTMERIDSEELDRMAGAYARYGGIDADTYRDVVLKPNMQQRMYQDYVERSTPKNSLEYIARGVIDGSVTGKAINLAMDKFSQTDSQSIIDREGMANYDANRAENFAAGVGSLLFDAGVFGGLGGVSGNLVGKSTSLIGNALTKRLMARGAARGLSGEMAKRIVDRNFLQNLGTRILQSGSTQGLTLGAYDATNSVVEDLLYGDGVTAGKVAGAFGKGFGTGMALGAVGVPLRQASKGLTGAKKVAASAGVLSAESAVFTLGVEAEKLASGVEIEPIDLLGDFGESAATLLTMRMAHWRPKGATEKLNADGRLKPELSFNAVERQEIRDSGVNPGEFISHLEQSLQPRYGALRGVLRNNLIRNYETLMSSEGLSASTRSKLLYIVENKMTSTPPVGVNCDVNVVNGGFVVDIKDNYGRRVERHPFASREEADAFVDRNSGVMRRNRIATIEDEFRRSSDSENFFRQAGEYARETGVNVNEISNAMYRKAQGKSLTSREMQLLDDIMYRSSYNDVEHGNVMHSIRNGIEQRYGLPKGTLLTSVDKRVSECSDAENSALAEYEMAVRRQSELMQGGVSPEMHADAARLIEDNGFEGHGDDWIRNYERRYNRSVAMRPLMGNPDIKSSYSYFFPEEYEYVKKHGYPYPADGEPRIGLKDRYNPTIMYMYSHDDLARMAVEARDVAKKLKTDVKLIYDVHEFDQNDIYSGLKMSSKGWHDGNSNDVIVNLARNENVEDAGFTVLHEVVGHKGFDNLFGRAYEDFLTEMNSRITPEVAKEVQKIKSEYNFRYDEEALDEYLAIKSESLNKTPAERSIMQRLKYFVQSSLNRMGVKIKDLSEDKIMMLLHQHRKAIENRIPAKKHRQGVFGSFKTSYLDDSYYNSAFGRDDGKMLMRHRFRFIGEKGADNLKKRNKKQAMTNLGTAKFMSSRNGDISRIKSSTGWEKGADGKWRFEIDDSQLDVKYFPETKLRREHPKLYKLYNDMKNGNQVQWNKEVERDTKKIQGLIRKYAKEDVRLEDAVPDEIFYDAYPEFKDIKVVYEKPERGLCQFSPIDNIFYIDKSAIGTEDLNRSVAMEMQKMIQVYEGFSRSLPVKPYVSDELYFQLNEPLIHTLNARGTDNRFYDANDAGRVKRLLREKYNIDDIDDVPSDPAKFNDFYLSLLRAKPTSQSGGVEVQNVGERFNYSEEERKLPAEYTESVPRSRQISPLTPADFHMMLQGPLDIIKEMGLWKYNREKKNMYRNGTDADGKPLDWKDYYDFYIDPNDKGN